MRKKINHPATGLVLSLLLGSFFALYQGNLTAEVLPPLSLLKIDVYGDTTIDSGETLRMTAIGYYGTATAPIKPVWRLVDGPGSLRDCALRECTYVSTDAGSATVEVEAHNQTKKVQIQIRGESVIFNDAFTDAIPSWAAAPIISLNKKKILRGYDDGRFGAGDTLTRGQLVTLIYRMLIDRGFLEDDTNCQGSYTDVPSAHFAYRSTCTFRAQGWSVSLREFDVNAPASRATIAIFLTRILGPELLATKGMSLGDIIAKGTVFSDIPLDHNSFIDSGVMKAIDIMQGYNDGSFKPEQILNRAEAATVIDRALRIIDMSGITRLSNYDDGKTHAAAANYSRSRRRHHKTE